MNVWDHLKRNNLKTKSNDELIVLINELYDANTLLEKKMHEEEHCQKLSSMCSMDTSIAYELETPINMITFNLNFIANNIEESDPVHNYIKPIHEEVNKIKQIARQLLNLAPPSDEDSEEIDLNALLEIAPIKEVLARMVKKGYTVSVAGSPHVIKIYAVQSHITEVLLNLIANAEEAMAGDAGILKITIDVLEREDKHYAAIAVEDTGMGIPPEQIHRIFEPFFTTKGKKSSGLGLMVVYAIINNLGGSIGVRSEVGKGTIVKVLLPALPVQ